MDDLTHIHKLDRELLDCTRDIKVLSSLSWDPKIQIAFLQKWQHGQASLPTVEYQQKDHAEVLSQLSSLATRAEQVSHPLADYISKTARSYFDAVRMLEHLGDTQMAPISISIYGRPGDSLSGGKGTTSLDAANYFLKVANEFYQNHQSQESEYCVTAHAVKKHLEDRLTEVFPSNQIEIVIDKNLASKAAAGATRIRLRDATCFSDYDSEQLLQHEAFVHSLTSLNGRAQPNLKSMSLGSPRTTAVQEGLATFSELITGAIDIARLERIAMRIIAIDMALSGADFVDVFRYFIESGQPESESFSSTMRVFRGVPLGGGHAFTKDAVYLHGLLEVHTFFRWALRQQKLIHCENFFAGRMTLSDAVQLEPLFRDGILKSPLYLPPWMTRTTGLGGYLAFSVFANVINIDELHPEHDFNLENRTLP